MRNLTRTVAALAGAATLSLGLTAAPAVAAPGDPATLVLSQDTFTAGNWEDGIDFTVTDVPEEATEVTLTIGVGGQNGAGLAADPVIAEEQPDGSYTGNVTPEPGSGPVAPDEDGFPKYTASASYTYVDDNGDEQFVFTNVDLTIEEGATVTGPEEATVGELAEGVDLTLAGFASGAEVTGDIQVLDTDSNDWDSIGDFDATLGPDGSGEGALVVTGVSAEQQLRVVVTGGDSTVSHYIRVLAGGEEVADEEGAAVPTAPVRPTRVDTGA